MTTPNAVPTEDPQVTRAAARVGMVLQDKWTLDAVLGVGGMAAVYAATHRNGKRVAVKVLHVDMGRDAEVKQRFLGVAHADHLHAVLRHLHSVGGRLQLRAALSGSGVVVAMPRPRTYAR